MTASEVKAIVAGLVLVCGAAAGATLWRQQHPDVPMPARLASAPPEARPTSPTAPKPQESAKLEVPARAPEAAKPAPVPPKSPDPTVAPPKPEPTAGAGEPPHFDVVRVEPTGEAVLAGKGDPNAKIELLASGKVIAETKADPNGHFVILPSALTPGNYDMTLRQTTEGKPVSESPQTVTVSVPQKKDGQVVVAMAEPGKPTKLLAGPPDAPHAPSAPDAPAKQEPSPPIPAAPTPSASIAKPQTAVVPPAAIKPPGLGLAIRSVELENGNGFFASGAAAAGTHVQVYLNGAHVAEVVAGPDGQWSVTVKKGLTGGHYAVRADAAGDGGAVTARVEVPFDVPVAMAQVPKPAERADLNSQPPASNPVQADPVQAKPSEAEPDQAKPDQAGDAKPSEVAGPGPEPSPRVVLPPERPAAPPPAISTPRPDLAAAAKAAIAAAPATAPPTLAAVPPAASAATAPAPAQMPIAPAKPTQAPPTLASETPSVAPPARTDAPASGANAVIEQIETAVVVRGDNLWNISRARLGHGKRFTQIYAANVSQIRDPKLIYPGQVFVVPSK